MSKTDETDSKTDSKTKSKTDSKNSMEDAMSSPPDISAKLQELTPSIPTGVENMLSMIVNLNEDNILHEPTCLICSNGGRKDIETKWLETKNHDQVKDAFKNEISLSNDVIDNHMRFHHERGIKELQKAEYIHRIERIGSVDLTTLDRIKFAFSAIEERMVGINSITPSGDLSTAEIEKIKSVETARLMACFNQTAKLKASIMGELHNNGQLITIPRDAFVKIFNDAIVEASTDKEKETIINILNRLGDLSKSAQ